MLLRLYHSNGETIKMSYYLVIKCFSKLALNKNVKIFKFDSWLIV